MSSRDEILSTLLEMGFPFADCEMALSAGCTNVEQAVNHLTQVGSQHAFVSGSTTSETLHLSRREPPKDGAESSAVLTESAVDSGSNPEALVHSRYTVTRDAQRQIAEKKAQQLKEEVIRDKELKRTEHESLRKEIQADKRARQELRNLSEVKDSQNDHQNSLEDDNSIMKSRYDKKLKDDIDWNNKMHDKLSEQMRKEREMKNAARLEALKRIEEDKQRRQNAQMDHVENKLPEPSSSKLTEPVSQSSSIVNESPFINIRFRLPAGESITEKFLSSSLVSVLFDFVETLVKSKDFTVAESFPPFKELDRSLSSQTLRSLNMGSNVALVIKVIKIDALVEVAPKDIIQSGPTVSQSAGAVGGTENDSDLSSGEDISDIPYQALNNVIDDQNDDTDQEMGDNPMDIENAEGANNIEPPELQDLGNILNPTVARIGGAGNDQQDQEQIEGSDDEDEDAENEGDDQEPVAPMRPGIRGQIPINFGLQNTGAPQYNISQRLGSLPTSSQNNAETSNNLTVESPELNQVEESREMRRLRFLEATQQRLAQTSPNDGAIELKQTSGLKFSCSSLRTISAEIVLRYFLEQKVNIGSLDRMCLQILLKMLQDRCLLNGKTYHPFITSGITTLDLAGYQYLTNDLVRTISFSSLRQLNIRGGENLTDFALGYIGEIMTLGRLVISHCPNFTSAAVGELLKKLPNLEIFEAASTKFNSTTVRSLVDDGFVMKSLMLLDLSTTFQDDAELIAKLAPNLVSLLINNTNIVLLEPLIRLKRLRSLSASNCALRDITILSNLPKLDSLDITNSCHPAAMSQIFDALSNLNLRKFSIPLKSNFTDKHLLALANMNLSDLDLTNCCHVTPEGFQTYFDLLVSEKKPTLQSLILSNTNFDSRSIPSLCKLSLNELNLDYTKITDQDVGLIQNLTVLSTLSLVGNNLSDNIFTSVRENEQKLFCSLVSLTKLNLSRNPGLSNFGLKRLEHPTLEFLAVMQTKVTNAIEDILRNAMPKLKVIKF